VDFADDTMRVFDRLTGEVRGEDLRGSHESVELYVRPGAVQRGAAQLDQRPCGCTWLPGRSAEGACL
jgi:hypothetical protein